MLSKEAEKGVQKSSSSGTVALLWLTRALELIIEVLTELSSHPDGDMHELCRNAYTKTLMKHHNAIMKNLFYVSEVLFCLKVLLILMNFCIK